MWYATRRFYADRILTIQPEADGSLVVHIINDTDETWEAPLTVRRVEFDGTEKACQSATLDVPPRSRLPMPIRADSVAQADNAARECIVATADDARAFWYFGADKTLAYPTPEFDADLAEAAGGYALTIKAKSFLRDLCVFADRLDPDASIDDQLVTLLPGEDVTFSIVTEHSLEQAAATAPPVLQCANRFGAAPTSEA